MDVKPNNLNELLQLWRGDLARLATDRPTDVAYDMVGRLLGDDDSDWYDGNQTVLEIFDLVSALEIAYDHQVYSSQAEIEAEWSRVKDLVAQLENELSGQNIKPELIVYVNPDGTPTGETAPKLEAHNANTKLHLAFSCYVFNDQGQVLVTRRALTKKVWPGVWTNSFCGHPGPNEAITDAIARRADFELGLKFSDVRVVLPNYAYITPPFNGIIENEFCPVYLAKAATDPLPNPDEVDSYKWLEWADFTAQLSADTGDVWSFWCKDQVKQFHQTTLKEYMAQHD